MDRRKLEFPAFDQGGEPGGPPGILQEEGACCRWPARPILVAVSEPSLHLFGRVRKGQEPMRVRHLLRKRSLKAE